MKKTMDKIRLSKLWAIILVLILTLSIIAPLQTATVSAQQRYCDEEQPVANSIGVPRGEGGAVDDNQYIYYDYRVVSDKRNHSTAPSVGNGISSMQNMCSPVTGTNVIQFYDRCFPNLIQDFEPGMEFDSGYEYFPDGGFAQTQQTINTLYSLMETNVGGGGTTFNGFKNGLTSFINSAGYNVNYSSFYSSPTNVNLSMLKTAVDNNKVGVVFLSAYNFIYDVVNYNDGVTTRLVKINAARGHAMMVYGYFTVQYFKNNSNFRTDTYLYVSSAYQTNDQGFMLVDDYLNIDNAIILDVY